MIKLIKQSHEILAIGPVMKHENGFDIQGMLEQVGRTCYQSQDKITSDSAEKFVRGLVKRGHHAMLEFVDVTIRFVTNRGVSHELVRHRLCNFAQESTRYVTYDKPVPIIIPGWAETLNTVEGSQWDWDSDVGCWPVGIESLKLTDQENNWLCSHCYVAQCYQWAIKMGMAAQDARGMLPNDLKTEIVVKANLREWMHIMALRAVGTTGNPHPQMQALMLPVLEELTQMIPEVFGDLWMQAVGKGLAVGHEYGEPDQLLVGGPTEEHPVEGE